MQGDRGSWREVLAHRRFVRIALSHALCIGALLTFVSSAPQLVVNALALAAPGEGSKRKGGGPSASASDSPAGAVMRGYFLSCLNKSSMAFC